MPTVFLSSVAQGLESYREAVYKAIEGLDGYHCVRMENFGARDETPYSVCLTQVRDCDVFVGIVGQRYGSIASESGKSFSETEYDVALASHKPMLMFLAPEEFAVPSNLIETDQVREKQANFRARIIQQKVFALIEEESPYSLAKQVIQAIHNRRSKSLQEGSLTEGRIMTKLLFPFVTNQAGFDTGISISNISEDPFGSEKNEGTCTIYYYGRVLDGGPAPGPQTSFMLYPGEQLNFTLFNGGFHLIYSKAT